MRIDFAAREPSAGGAVAAPVLKGGTLATGGLDLDRLTGGLLTRAVKLQGGELKRGACLDLIPPEGAGPERVVLFGLGTVEDASAFEIEKTGADLAAKLKELKLRAAEVAAAGLDAATVARLAAGARLRLYAFEKYRTGKDEDAPAAPFDGLTFLLPEADDAGRAYAPAERVAEGVIAARDLASEPANVLYPESFAEACKGLGELGVEVEVFDAEALKEMGFGALLSVGQGSVRPPCVAVMSWKGGEEGGAPVALIGKGVCFDTGGISIKAAAGMEDMKWDMAGAGAVFGAMKALAGRKSGANVVGVVGLAENMPSGTATRPGDVVRSLSGQTIEVINTDAEGRVLLADVLWYAKERFKPKVMIDLATLTGAIIIALGHEQAGLFTPDDDLAAKLVAAGKEVGEPLWRMPLGEAYEKHIKSEIADMKNVGRARQAGATAGAVFLQRFVGDVSWAHLDIAAMAWSSTGKPLSPKGATGYGVRLLDRYVSLHHEARG